MKLTKKTVGKIGLFTSISIMIGSIVGIGIFFKNNSIFKINQGSGLGVLISWILASIIAFATAFAFGEIGFGKNPQAGLAGTAESFFGKKSKNFFSFSLGTFYYGILTLAIALFSAESIVNIFNGAISNNNEINNNFPIWGIFIIGLGLLIIFFGFNLLSQKISHYFQNSCTILKFIPLIFVILIGIIGACQGIGTNGFKSPIPLNNNLEQNSKLAPSAIGILSSLPSILFAYDSFLCIGNLKNELRNPDKNISLTIVLGMLICVIFYLLITISEILIGQGTADGVINTFFNQQQEIAKALGIIINIFILIAVTGVLNALTITGMRAHEYLIKSQSIIGAFKILKFSRFNTKKAGLIVSTIIFLFWWIILLIPCAITNNDGYIDLISNFPTLFYFAIYGSLVLMGFINRFTKKVDVKKIKGFMFFAPISIIGCYLVFGYQFFYGMLVQPILTPNTISSFGVFLNNGSLRQPMLNWQAALIFFLMITFFIVSGLINEYFLNKKKNQTIIAISCLNQYEKKYFLELKQEFNKSNKIINNSDQTILTYQISQIVNEDNNDFLKETEKCQRK